MKSRAKRALLPILRFLARATLARYQPAIIGVTGSVGKTSAKEAISAVIKRERSVRAPSKSFNNELGLPLTILGDWDKTGGAWFWLKVIVISAFRLVFKNPEYPEVLVLEYGVDHPGDMGYLLKIAKPHIGIITAVGATPVHVEFFSGPEAVLREKAKLAYQLPTTGFAILNIDDEAVAGIRGDLRAQVITYGFSENAQIRLAGFSNRIEDNGTGGVAFKLAYGGSVVPIQIPGSLGRGQGYAAAAAAAVGLLFGMNLVTIGEALARHYHPAPGRMRILSGVKGSILIDDTYNASPMAVHEALDTLKHLAAKRRIAVLGDMLEIGTYTLREHESVGKQAAKCLDLLIAVGLRGKFIAESAVKAGMRKQDVIHAMNIAEAGKILQERIGKGDVVLVKGSQGVRLEKIVAEVMAHPELAEETLVRQNSEWLARPGLYG